MKRTLRLAASLIVLLLAGCVSGAPQAPMGFSKRPANSPATIAGLLRPADVPAPPATQPSPPAYIAPPPAEAPPSPIPSSVAILSDRSAPGGLLSLPAPDRARLVARARAAHRIGLYCRGDRTRLSRSEWRALIRRGAAVKRYLVGQGVAPSRIRIYAKSAGDFIADNSTSVGRAQNRRVEIHFE